MSERKSQALGRHVIIADDDRAIRLVIADALEGAGYNVSTVADGEDLWTKVRDGAGDVVITDVLMPGRNGLDLLPLIKEHRPELPVIVMSAQNTLMTAVKATEKGAFDYLAKPFDLDDLERMVAKALERRALVDEEVVTGNPVDADTGLIGRSPAMQGLFRSMARLMNTDLTVMIAGESGTGKELVARALHDMGKRRNGPFVALNMAAIPRDLIESELFGHEKGAFTGAHMRAIGRFEQAQGGTLFLDEIGDMPMEAQTRLLRVLQEGIFFRIGSERSIEADARIIAASNRDLGRLVTAGTFREDLYYRLNVVPLCVPPLRARTGDIPDLVAYFVAMAVKEGLPAKQFDKKALLRLQHYHWPGNVRELENLVHRLLALAAEELIDEATLNRFLDERALTEGHDRDKDESNDGLQAVVERQLRRYFDAHGNILPPAGLYARVLREVERPLLMLALKATGGNQLQAAELLGVNRNTLRKKMRDLEIVSRNFKS